MSQIHMNTENIEQLARQMRLMMEELNQTSESLRRRIRQLPWNGGDRDHLVDEGERITRRLNALSEEGVQLSRDLTNEANQWLEVDNHFGDLRRLGPTNNQMQYGSRNDLSGLLKIFNWTDLLSISTPIAFGAMLFTRIWQNWGWLSKDYVTPMIQYADRSIFQGLQQLFGAFGPKSTPSVHLKLGGEFTFPGAEFAIPASIKGSRDTLVDLIRNPDGTYTLKMAYESKAGLEHELLPHAGVTIGGDEYKVGPSIKGEALLGATTGAAFTFNPNKAGDLSKMVALITALGLSQSLMFTQIPPEQTVLGPALYTLKDNLTEVSVGNDINAKVDLHTNALVKLVGVEGEHGVGSTGSIIKENDKWYFSQDVSLEEKLTGSILTWEGEVHSETSLKRLVDTESGANAALLTLKLKAGQKGGLDESILKDLISQDGVSPIIGFKATEYDQLTVTYRIDQPVESVQAMLQGTDGPDWNAIIKNSSVEVKGMAAQGQEIGLGAEVGVGAGQEISGKVGGEGEFRVENVIYKYGPAYPKLVTE